MHYVDWRTLKCLGLSAAALTLTGWMGHTTNNQDASELTQFEPEGSSGQGPSVMADPARIYPNPAHPEKRWRLVWSDEFNGPPCDPAQPGSCPSEEDWLRTVQCYGTPDSPVGTVTPHRFHVNPDRPEEWSTQVLPHLSQLDKCTWLVSDHVNLIHGVRTMPITAYKPTNVDVSKGELRITTRRFRPPSVDCGHKIDPNGSDDEHNLTKDCPFTAGTIFSYAMNGVDNAGSPIGNAPGDGMLFREGGRLEVRSRLPGERGNMSALWTWQQDWRQSIREIDLMENWVTDPAEHLMSIHSPRTYIRHEYEKEYKWNLYDEFHIFGLEWKGEDFMTFTMDNRPFHTWHEGDLIDDRNGGCVENHISRNPFYFIIWNLMIGYENKSSRHSPIDNGQRPDSLYVDYIRYYEPCSDANDPSCMESTLSPDCPNPCEDFGAFDGFNCYVGSSPGGRRAKIVNGEYAYKAKRRGLFGRFYCPYGGVRDGKWCLLGGPPPGRAPFVYDDHFYAQTTCSPTALPNCSQPCPWEDTVWEKGFCRVGPPPAGTQAFVYGNAYYYERLTNDPATACSAGGTWDGANCLLGYTPAGANARVIDNVFFLDPDYCPYGGIYDSATDACLLKALPTGAKAFAWEGALYYESPYNNTCPYGGWYDGANCYLEGAPAGSEPYAVGNRLYTPAVCKPTTDWVGLQSSAAKVKVKNLCR